MPIDRKEDRLVSAILDQIAEDLSLMTDKPVVLSEPELERTHYRVPGEGEIQIAFKLQFELGESRFGGAVLVSLADARTLALFFRRASTEVIEEERKKEGLDPAARGALLEAGQFLAGSIDAALQEVDAGDVVVSSAGCQGLRPNQVPTFEYEKGATLFVIRASIKIADFPYSRMVLMLPATGLGAAIEPSRAA